MRKTPVIISFLLIFHLLALPQFAALAAEAEAVRASVIDPALSDAYDTAGGSAKQNVLVYIDDIEQPTRLSEEIASDLQSAPSSLLLIAESNSEDSSASEIEAIQAKIAEKRRQSRELYDAQNTAFAERCLNPEDIVYISHYSPVIITTLNETQANRLALNDQVTSIELYAETDDLIKQEESPTAPLADVTATNYLSMIRASTPKNLYSGTGIKVGVLDQGIPTDTSLGVIESFSPDTNNTYAYHANLVASIIKSIAPNVQLYAARLKNENSQVSYHIQAIEWLLSKNVNIINASCAVGYDANNGYGAMAKWLDHIAIDHCVTFVKSAGNDGSSGVNSGAMSYNSIVVGSVDSSYTHYQNSSYNFMPSNFAQKPDICAPGVNIGTGSYSPQTGTSYAAPQVTGAIALMCQQKSDLLIYPETIKAVLTAGVNRDHNPNITSPLNNTNPYYKYGAGILDCTRNYQILRGNRYYSNDFDPYATGIIQITNEQAAQGLNVRVSLTYIQYTTAKHPATSLDVTQYSLPDLEVRVTCKYEDNTSETFDSNYDAQNISVSNAGLNVKIISFTTSKAGSYTISVYVQTPTESDIFYGVAWCVN